MARPGVNFIVAVNAMRDHAVTDNTDVAAVIFGVYSIAGITLIANIPKVGISSVAGHAVVNPTASTLQT